MNDTAREVIARLPTAVFCRQNGMQPDRNGKILCPFHGDRDKSLLVYKDPSRGWYCFGCHRGGTVIDFAMAWYGLDFKSTIAKLNEEYGLGIETGRRLTRQERQAMQQEQQRRKQQREALEKAAKTAEDAFWYAHNVYCHLLHLKEQTRPKDPSEAINATYGNVLALLPQARDDLLRAQDELAQRRKELMEHAERPAGDTPMESGGLPHIGTV